MLKVFLRQKILDIVVTFSNLSSSLFFSWQICIMTHTHTPNRRCRCRRLRLRHLKYTVTCDFRNRRLQIFADNGTCDIIEDRPATCTCGGTFSLKTATCDFQTGDFNKSPMSAPATIYETNRRPAPAAAPWFENRYLRLLNRHLRQRCL